MTEPSDDRRLPSRRSVLRILAVGGLGGAALWRFGRLDLLGHRVVQRSRMLMGTIVNLTLVGERDEARAAADATLDRMAALDVQLSRHRPDSELSKLNATGRVDAPSRELLDILRLAERVSRLGDGAFDVSIQPVLDLYGPHRPLPAQQVVEQVLERVDYRAVRIEADAVTLTRPGMRLTLDGVGKGYVVDRGIDELRERGFGDVFVEAGGDLVASGSRQGGEPWRVGIRHPRAGLSLQARFEASDVAVATSGDYMQPYANDFSRHHIVDPRTGLSSPELASSTVVAPNAATADALATVTLALGSRAGRDLLETLPGCEGYFVSKRLEVTRTSGFATA